MLKIDLVSPDGQIINSKEASYLRIQSQWGELTILPGHRQSLILLGKGIMEFGDNQKYVLYKGLLEILQDDTVNIVAERVKVTSEIDKREVESRLKIIETRLLTESLNDQDYNAVIDEYTDCIAELTAV